jgi:hypothetical protein
MKVWSPLIAFLLLKSVTAQLEDIGIEAIDDDTPILG